MDGSSWYGGSIPTDPRSPHALSLAALAGSVRRATGALGVTLGQRLQELWGGYGELWRAELQTAAGTLPVIVKVVRPARNDASRSQRRKLRSYDVEHTFYERYAARCSEPPSCRVARPVGLLREAGGWVFVLEDLNASGFSSGPARTRAADISATLRWLATFHARFLGTAPEGLWKVGTYWQLGTRPDELAVMRHPTLKQGAGRIDTALNAAQFKTLVHGDAKTENVCVHTTGEVALVDFQYVGAGVGVKDVAYLLNGCLRADECETLVPRYLDEYFRELRTALAANPDPRNLDVNALEREWRALFPLAWVDFYRFLLGWAPGQFDGDPYSEALTHDVLAGMGC